MNKSIEAYVQQCDNCQRTKSQSIASLGLLQPLPIPDHVWNDITMDFITHLPKSNNATVIYVVVDRLSKYSHFFPLQYTYAAKQVAKIFFDGIFKLYGMPQSIVSDRDSIFLSKFWQELFDLQGCSLKFSSTYHPQTDGQIEIINKILENYLRFCVPSSF